MARWLLALYALQAIAQVAGFGSSIDQVHRGIGTGWAQSRAVATGAILGQVLITCVVIYDEWRKEREARERLSR